MATCGHCKESGQTVAHIRSCAQSSPVAVLDPYAPAVLTTPVVIPESMYAVELGGKIQFFRVRYGRKGTKWEGFAFVDRLVGHPGDWVKYPVKGAARKEVLALIATDPKEHALAFSFYFTVCAACGSPLSDPESLARGFGPVCAARY